MQYTLDIIPSKTSISKEMPHSYAIETHPQTRMKQNRKDHQKSETNSLYRQILCKKMLSKKSLSGSFSSLPDRLEEKELHCHDKLKSKKTCSCDHIRTSTSCVHDHCGCEFCGESFETRFGNMDGRKLASFYKLWDRPSRQDNLTRSLERPRSLERADKYRDCGCYTRTFLRQEQKCTTRPLLLH